MKLTIAGKPVAIPIDTKISIQRSSPLLNDDTGSFSFPFPVPTFQNQYLLGWPGRLQRVGDIADQSFVLEDSGLQVFRGEVEYDTITEEEIGVILKSGNTEFSQKMTDLKLADIDFGGESWPLTDGYFGTEYVTYPAVEAKLNEWNDANVTDNGKYVVTPFWISDFTGEFKKKHVNRHLASGTEMVMGINFDMTTWWEEPANSNIFKSYFALQFKVSFVVNAILKNAGLTIIEDQFTASEFNKAIIYGKVMEVVYQNLEAGHAIIYPDLPSLKYASLMPDLDILEFLDAIKKMFCLMFIIDDRKHEVRIIFKKDIFIPENTDNLNIKELKGWEHKEVAAMQGFALRYSSQDNDKDLEYDYTPYSTVQNTLPAAWPIGRIMHVTDYARDYIVVQNDDNTLSWMEYGRLKEAREGKAENMIEIKVNIPQQKWVGIMECPWLPGFSGTPSSYQDSVILDNIDYLAISLYHGKKSFNGTNYPFTSYDQFFSDPEIKTSVDTSLSLKPSYLYDKVYKDFINWQTYRARAFTKYIDLSLIQLLALQWGKRYNISGIEVILDKINYELPHKGTVKIEGFTS